MAEQAVKERPRRLLVERIPLRAIILVILAIVLTLGIVLGSVATLSEGKLNSEAWRGLIVGGLAQGSIYAIIAVGYTLVYGILFMINFAHGEVFMAGAFSTLFVAKAFSDSGFLNEQPIIALAILFLCSMAISSMVAIVLERVAYRPLRGAPRLIPLITAIGASFFLQNTFFGLFGASTVSYPNVEILNGQFDLFGILLIGRKQLLVILSAAILMIGLYIFVERTKTGRSMRAVGEDKEIAALMGIDVDRTIVTTFAIGGMLAGAAGVLYALLFQVNYFMGFVPGIKAFTAAVLGGIGNIVGAGLGGIALGLIEQIGPTLFLSGADIPSPDQLQPVIAFGVLVFVLIFRPGGILGASEEARA